MLNLNCEYTIITFPLPQVPNCTAYSQTLRPQTFFVCLVSQRSNNSPQSQRTLWKDTNRYLNEKNTFLLSLQRITYKSNFQIYYSNYILENMLMIYQHSTLEQYVQNLSNISTSVDVVINVTFVNSFYVNVQAHEIEQ